MRAADEEGGGITSRFDSRARGFMLFVYIYSFFFYSSFLHVSLFTLIVPPDHSRITMYTYRY